MGLVVNILFGARPLDDRFWLGVDVLLEKQGFALEFTQDPGHTGFSRLVEGNTPDVDETYLAVRCDEEGQAAVTVQRSTRTAQDEDVYNLSWDGAMQARLKKRTSYLRLLPAYGEDDSLEFFNALVEAAACVLDGLTDDPQAGVVSSPDGSEFDYPPDAEG